MSKLSHIDSKGKPQMVDVGNKKITKRTARAQARVFLPEVVARQFTGKDIESKKGPVFQDSDYCRHHGCQENFRADPALPSIVAGRLLDRYPDGEEWGGDHTNRGKG